MPAHPAAAYAQRVLLPFDIDGTLLLEGATPVGEAMSAALAEVHGIDTSEIRSRIYRTAGRTHGEIARAILLDAGVPGRRIDARRGRVREACCDACARLLPDDLSWAVLPGVRELGPTGWPSRRT